MKLNLGLCVAGTVWMESTFGRLQAGTSRYAALALTDHAVLNALVLTPGGSCCALQAIHYASQSQLGSYRDPVIAKTITEHNAYVHSPFRK
jgi:hypothetical protein